MRYIKQIFLFLTILTGGVFMMTSASSGDNFSQHNSNEVVKEIKKKIAQFDEKRPEDRVYLMFDKPFYYPGETIWFQAYLRNSADMKPSVKSEILHVEFISPRGSREKELQLIVREGVASGDIKLDEDIAGGLYTVKAYSKWQKNSKFPPVFEKEIPVQKVVLPSLKMKLDFPREAYGKGEGVSAKFQVESLDNQPLGNKDFTFRVNLKGDKFLEKKGVTNSLGEAVIEFDLPDSLDTSDALLNVMIPYQGKVESIFRSIPILLNNLHVELFPEGGDLVEGFPSRVAFRALDEFGKPADVQGVVKEKEGTVITDFQSFHQGLGAFSLTSEKDKAYFVQITQPAGVEKIFPLPRAMTRGYTVEGCLTENNNIELIVRSTEQEELSIVARSRGEKVRAFSFKAEKGENRLDLPTDHFPMGVVQITLFDSKGIERAERLLFVNRDNRLKVEIKSDKEQYLPREKVKMEVNVSDERGMPIPAQLSLSVTDDKIISFADDKSGHILSKLLLEPDLKTQVYEPNFYFDDTEEKSFKAMDYLMMTHGWRRFTWKEVREIEKYTPEHAPEKAEIKGVVISSYHQGKPVEGAEVKVGATGKSYVTDKNGEFVIRDLNLHETRTLTAQKGKKTASAVYVSDYNTHVTIYLERIHPGLRMRRAANAVDMPMAGLPPNEGEFDDFMILEEEAVLFEAAEVPAQAEEDDPGVDMLKAEPVDKMEKPGKGDMDMDVELEAVHPAEEKIADFRLGKKNKQLKRGAKPVPAPVYYRARVFPAPIYKKMKTEQRTDFRSTIFWKGDVETGRNGKCDIEFYNSDEITAFRTVVEGIGIDGLVGRREHLHHTQLPFSLNVKIPVEVSMGDEVLLPLTIINNSDEDISGNLKIQPPESWIPLTDTETRIKVAAKDAVTRQIPFSVMDLPGKGVFAATFTGETDRDSFQREVTVAPKGFPVSIGVSSQEREHKFNLKIAKPVNGTVQARLTAYPTVLSDMLAGIESILREPYGCFEQTSSSTYPNIMVMDYLRENEYDNSEVLAKAKKLIEKGYKRLISFETKKKGYEWFGAAPGHEALTAYGFMEFKDMQKVFGGVDDAMLERTKTWLLSRRDGKGGFKRNQKALDSFGRAESDITNAYIVYTLSEAGFIHEIEKELKKACETAQSSDDPYQLALVTNALFNVKDNKAPDFLKKLLKHQKQNGSWSGKLHSVTCSTGTGLDIETTSLALLAILKSDKKDVKAMDKGIRFIIKSRSPSGGFGNTQSTVLALKALIQYTKFSRKTAEAGTIEIHVNGQKTASKSYGAGETDEIVISQEQLNPFFKQGEYTVEIKYKDVKNPLPYTFSLNYNTFLPTSSNKCNVGIETSLSSEKVKKGETVRLTTTLTNKKAEGGLPMTLAIVGIPGGLTPQPWQLKEMTEKKQVDFFEVMGSNVVFYYRQMKPGEIREINLDLKADIPGTYQGAASCAYLYYTNEYKEWIKGEKIVIE